MTPLIREMVSINPEASTDYMWFDATAVAHNVSRHPTAEVLSLPMPLDAAGTLQVKKIEGGDRQLTHEIVQSTVSTFCEYLRSIHSPAPIPGYTPVDKQKFVNKKRIAKGKAPIYEWHTVVIEPPKPKVEPKGGTHASPRLHDRRGHWRTCKDGMRKIWVKACKVGNAAKGTVFKDYTWKSNDATRQA